MKKFKNKNIDDLLYKANLLQEAIEYITIFAEENLVIFFDTNLIDKTDIFAKFARNIVLLNQLGISPIIVHNGNYKLDSMFKKLGHNIKYVDNIPIYDQETVEIAEMYISGHINKSIVQAINNAGGNAIGVSGKDNNLIEAKKIRHSRRGDSNIEMLIDYGFSGEASYINPDLLLMTEESKTITVIAPIGVGEGGETIFIEPYKAASKISSSLAAGRLIYVTAEDGVFSKDGELISEVTLTEAKKLAKSKQINGEIRLMLEASVEAIEQHTESAHIIPGNIADSLFLELFTEDRVGTMIHSGL